MDAKTAGFINKILISNVNLLKLNEHQFECLRNSFFGSVLCDGTVVLCVDDLYMYLSGKWIHLKYCGCDGKCSNNFIK